MTSSHSPTDGPPAPHNSPRVVAAVARIAAFGHVSLIVATIAAAVLGALLRAPGFAGRT